MHLKNWTKEQEDQLRELAKTMTSSEIAPIIGRTVQSVRKRCCILGISLCGYREKVRSWTEDDIAELREYIDKGYSYKKIAEIMGRSESSISGRVFRGSFEATQSGNIDTTLWGDVSLMALRVPMNEIAKVADRSGNE